MFKKTGICLSLIASSLLANINIANDIEVNKAFIDENKNFIQDNGEISVNIKDGINLKKLRGVNTEKSALIIETTDGRFLSSIDGDLNNISALTTVLNILARNTGKTVSEIEKELKEFYSNDDIEEFIKAYQIDKFQFLTKKEKEDKLALMENFANEIYQATKEMGKFIKKVETAPDILESKSSSARKLRAKIDREVKDRNGYQAKYFNMDMRQGMDFGTSLNTLTDTVQNANLCLSDFSLTEPIFRGHQSYKFKLLEDLKDVQDFLHLDASLSLSMPKLEVAISGAYDDLKNSVKESVVIGITVEYQAYDYSLKSPKMSEDMAKLYEDGNSYEKFREKCGDKYLSTITSGGRYSGIIKLKTSSAEEGMAIKASLKGKITAGAISGSIEGNFEMSDMEILKSKDIKIDIISSGGKAVNSIIKDIDGFYASAEAFMGTFDALTADDPKGYKKSAFMAKYSDYATTTMNVKGGAIEKQREVKNEYVDYASIYTDIMFDINYIMTNYHLFVKAETKDEIMMAIKKDMLLRKAQLRHLNKLCSRTNPLTRQCTLIEDISENDPFPNEWETRDKLPLEKVRYPRTCEERREIFPALSKVDDEYRVYMSGDKLQPYDVYCQGMANNSAIPQEYLVLKNLSPISNHPAYNYSRYSSFIDNSGKTQDLVTIYDKLKVKVSWAHLSVFDEQDVFYNVVGGTLKDNDDNSFNVARYGIAKNLSSAFNGKANIDLSGTGFRVADEVKFIDRNLANSGSTASRYEFIDSPKNWREAKKYAKDIGGSLAVITSAQENIELKEFLENEKILDDIWIGLNDIDFENQFVWMKDEYFDYSNWVDGHPENNISKNCIAMNGTSTADDTKRYKWEDMECGDLKKFVIEFDTDNTKEVAIFAEDRQKVSITSSGPNGHIGTETDLILHYKP